MDLVSLLNNTANGLAAIQGRVATISNNIANASTPGYARQNANLAEGIPSALAGNRGFIGGGVILNNVTQSRDDFVEAQLPAAFSNSSSSTAESDALASVSTFNNGSAGDLTDALGTFYSSLTALAQNAGDSSLRQSTAQAAAWLAATFNRTSVALEQARTGTDSSIRGLVQQVNAALTQVGDLNRRISIIEASGSQPSDLLDQRHDLMDQISQLIGATQVPDAYGNISLVLPGGTTLLSASAAATLTMQADTANKGHLDIVFAPPDGSAPVVFGQGDLGGQIGGLLAARDGALGKASSDLDTLAFEFARTMNAQNRAGYTLDGNPGGDLFTAGATPSDAAAVIASNPALSTNPALIAAAQYANTVPGDGSNAQAMAATQSAVLSNGLDVQEGLAKIVADFGTASSNATDQANFDKTVLQNLQDSRQSTSGVSTDDEMVALMQAQHAFEAMAKVINATDDLLQALIALKS
jgi:flagellar hook-associated protein 1 FlgK